MLSLIQAMLAANSANNSSESSRSSASAEGRGLCKLETEYLQAEL